MLPKIRIIHKTINQIKVKIAIEKDNQNIIDQTIMSIKTIDKFISPYTRNQEEKLNFLPLLITTSTLTYSIVID